MKTVLILGGTNFVGRVLVEKLQNNPNYNLTLFNRGKRNAGIFPRIKQVHGDRETGDIRQITDAWWDYVIDLSGYYPVTFNRLLRDLDGHVGRYIFVSTVSVYDLGTTKEITEAEPTLKCTEEQISSALPDAYGEKKAEMERILMNCVSLDKVIFRPSLIYGKYDFTDRFYYWLWRSKFSSKIILPDGGSNILSLTYVEDFADLIIEALSLETHNTIYNAATHRLTLSQLTETCSSYTKLQPELVSLPATQILAKGLQPWQDIALWVNGDMKISMRQLMNDFKTGYTPFSETVEKTASYYETLGWPECRYGISTAKEMEVIKDSLP